MAWINLFKWRFNIIQKKALGSIGTSLTWAVMDKLLTKNSRTILSEDPVPSYFVCVSIKTRQSVKCKIDSTVPLMSMSNQLIFIPCILSRHKLFYWSNWNKVQKWILKYFIGVKYLFNNVCTPAIFF